MPCLVYTIFRKELRHIKNIEIYKTNHFKIALHKIRSKIEDLLFSIIQRIPERMIPTCLMNWVEKYTNKRIYELKQQIIRDRWHSVELEHVIEDIHNRKI